MIDISLILDPAEEFLGFPENIFFLVKQVYTIFLIL